MQGFALPRFLTSRSVCESPAGGDARWGSYEAISPVDNAFSRRSVFLIVPYPAYVGGFRDTQYLQVI